MRYIAYPLIVLTASLLAPLQAATLAPGAYSASGHTVYVGVQSDPPGNDFFDTSSQRTGDLPRIAGLRLQRAILEERRTLDAPQGRLGFSLYYAGEARRTTVILIHGNDPEAREMGFLIPFFVCNGVNVISYDQRGVGESTGNWFLNGPAQKAQDVAAIYDVMRENPHVDPGRIGVWGFSNGGWTAPLVATARPVAFLLLKSAPTQTLAQNIDYEVEQSMRQHGAGSAAPQAVALWHSFEGALDGRISWQETTRLYELDAGKSWFQYSLMPELGIKMPPPRDLVAGLRRFVSFDPTSTLLRVSRTPTLALYGARDRKVDAVDSAAHLRDYLTRAGNRDVTVLTFPNAGHPLTVTEDSYDAAPPERFVPEYPQILIKWLAQRGFTTSTTPDSLIQ